MLFDIANWLILGGALYLILDLIPNGPLSWKMLSKYSSQPAFTVQIMLIVGALIVAIQFLMLSLGGYLFSQEDWTVSLGGKPLLISSIFLIPLFTQLFRISSLSKRPLGRVVVSLMILLSSALFWFYTPTMNSEQAGSSILGGLENTLLFNYLCGALLFFIVLDFWLLLKKHKIIK